MYLGIDCGTQGLKVVVYSTTDGQTKNICSRIGEFLSGDTPSKIIPLSEATKDDIKKYENSENPDFHDFHDF